MQHKNIAIIGGGNLGSAIASGLIKKNFCLPEQITITKRNPDTLSTLKTKGITVTNDNSTAVKNADIIILAVKPFQAKEVLEAIKGQYQKNNPLLCSVVTGFSLEQIKSVTPDHVSVVRAMPNTAIAIGESMTCLCTTGIEDDQKIYIESLFNQLGKVVFINESLMDAATVLGACGIAYALRFIRANIQGGIEIGFDAATATLIASQTVKGAAELLIQTGHHPEQEIDKVTTPKGCTIAGLNEMEHQGFSSSLIKGISVSYQKIGK
jgi:pyrroline-5-carboxylate reductase